MYQNLKLKGIKRTLALLVTSLSLALFVQSEPVKTVSPVSGNNDITWYAIYAVLAILLFTVLMLSKVLINLVIISIEKDRAKAVVVILMLLVSTTLFAQNVSGPETNSSTPASSWEMITAISVLGIALIVALVLILRIRRLVDELAPRKEAAPRAVTQLPWSHKELSGSRRYAAVASIFLVFGCTIYLSFAAKRSSDREYESTMTVAKQQQAEYLRLNADKVDEYTVTMADAVGIEDGKTIFIANCAPCHGRNGEGVVGPNLTDDYWLHGGSLNDIFKSVKYGWPAKAMKSWQSDLTPVQIRNVVSYIKSLRGSNPPNAKASQGDLFNEGAPVKTTLNNQADGAIIKTKNG